MVVGRGRSGKARKVAARRRPIEPRYRAKAPVDAYHRPMRSRTWLVAALLLVAALARADEIAIVERLLPWDDVRTELTKEYRRVHQGEADPGITIEPKVIVLHWTGPGTLDSTWNTFAPSTLGGRPGLEGAGALNVAAHFAVDRDGTIVRLLPDDRFARHVIGLNQVAIGVENVGGGDTMPLTDAQIEANAALVRHLAGRHGITHLIGHHEYRKLEGHPYFVETDPGYRTGKIDPGPAFMAAVRERVADLELAGPPEG